jgi:hypothetical protein
MTLAMTVLVFLFLWIWLEDGLSMAMEVFVTLGAFVVFIIGPLLFWSWVLK